MAGGDPDADWRAVEARYTTMIQTSTVALGEGLIAPLRASDCQEAMDTVQAMIERSAFPEPQGKALRILLNRRRTQLSAAERPEVAARIAAARARAQEAGAAAP